MKDEYLFAGCMTQKPWLRAGEAGEAVWKNEVPESDCLVIDLENLRSSAGNEEMAVTNHPLWFSFKPDPLLRTIKKRELLFSRPKWTGQQKEPHVLFSGWSISMAVGQNQWHHFGVGAPPILVYFSGDWDVRWGSGILTHGHRGSSKDTFCPFETWHFPPK